MLSSNEILVQEPAIDYSNNFTINACVECKPIIVVNRNNLIVYSNQAAQITFGLNNIVKVSALPTDIELLPILNEFVESSYSSISLNLRIKNSSESTFGVYNAEVEKIELDNTQYLFFVFHQAEKEIILENRINSIHAAIELANLPVMTISANGKISFVSKTMEDILGFTIDELYEKFFCVPLENFLAKADLLTAERAFFLKQSWVKIISVKDKGKVLFKELQLTPFLNAGATENAFMLIAHDITDYVQKNLIVKESENKLKSIINNIRDPLFILKSSKEKLLFENGNNSFFRVFDLDKLKLVNNDVKITFKSELLKQVIKNCELIINDSQHSIEFKAKHNLVHYTCKLSLMDISTDSEFYIMIIFHNITEQENYQSKMRDAYEKEVQLNKLKTAFIENMSHEIRTPFNAITGYSEILEESIRTNDYKIASELVVLVKEVLSRVSHLFDHIIDMSEIESSEMVIDYVYLNCNQVLKSVYGKLYSIAKQKGIELELELADIEVIIKTDWVKLEKVVYAITENAIKYTFKGKVVLRSFVFSQFAYITVTDTGEGMNQEDIKFLLEPFSQEEQGYTRKYQGAGLGLAIASKLTKMMGGLFEIVSRKQTGTKVTIIYPIVNIH